MSSPSENSVIKCLRQRFSCRDFTYGEISREDLEIMIDAMRNSPSAGNLQPWHFYIVRNYELKKKLVTAAHGQGFIADAATVFVICAVPERSAKIYSDRGRELYCLQDTSAAVCNLIISSTALGYCSCWVGAFNENAVSEILDLPDGHRPVAIVPVGPGLSVKKRTARYETNQICTVMG